MSSATENSERLREPDTDLPFGVNGSEQLTAVQSALVGEYLKLIKKWDRVHSLVSKGDLNHLEKRHVLDSLALEPFLKPSSDHLDIGSGAGFPGIPLAICRPDVNFVLNDRSTNRCRFLREVKFRLNLANVDVQECDIGKQDSHSDYFDTISLRAVAAPEHAWSLALPLLSEQGSVLLYTQGRFPTDYEGFSQGSVMSCTPSVRGWITVVGKSTTS
ncbi:MAG: 16S rRNA (guanine(527)-N(7))-methyltransferase RsmG [Gammaproteobacteria bacterium]|nr:16S rRNA (guanine(527)-N(7))-methyltransferase RsmG [Gammaproteobacteria bacterium]MYF37911.1 16S rRNA (guanine(527)-N(7))-methyltransferase RsmG [Gammaproteobacteria bacterium]